MKSPFTHGETKLVREPKNWSSEKNLLKLYITHTGEYFTNEELECLNFISKFFKNATKPNQCYATLAGIRKARILCQVADGEPGTPKGRDCQSSGVCLKTKEKLTQRYATLPGI